MMFGPLGLPSACREAYRTRPRSALGSDRAEKIRLESWLPVEPHILTARRILHRREATGELAHRSGAIEFRSLELRSTWRIYHEFFAGDLNLERL